MRSKGLTPASDGLASQQVFRARPRPGYDYVVYELVDNTQPRFYAQISLNDANEMLVDLQFYARTPAEEKLLPSLRSRFANLAAEVKEHQRRAAR